MSETRKRGRPRIFTDVEEMQQRKNQQKLEYRKRNAEKVKERARDYGKQAEVLARRRARYKANKQMQIRDKTLDIVMDVLQKIAHDNKDAAWSFANLDRDTVRNFITVNDATA